MQVGAARGPPEFEPNGCSVVTGRDDQLVFVSRAVVPIGSVPEAEHVAVLQQALGDGWRQNSDTPTRLSAFVDVLHRQLLAQARAPNARQQWRLELCAMAVEPGSVWVVHVADHRVWQVRGELVEQLTVDETLAELMRRQGLPLPEGVDKVTTRALGLEWSDEQPIVVSRHGWQPGDSFVLTTGWFHREQAAAACETLLRRAGGIPDAETAARFLLAERALSLGQSSYGFASTGVVVVRP